METFRFWLENDTEIPRFKKLKFQKVKVPLADVLTRGIHPWQDASDRDRLSEKFIQVLNSDDFKPREMEQFKYCEDVSISPSRFYYRESSQFEETLARVSEGVHFVDGLSYTELLQIAKERLRKEWSHRTGHQSLSRTCSGFYEMRSFLKAKDKEIKLSSYSDIDRYDLGRILSLEDFYSEDGNLISVGLPLTNFRSVKFLKSVIGERGLLRLRECIKDFQIIPQTGSGVYYGQLTYNCKLEGGAIRFRPELDRDTVKRDLARAMAAKWRVDNGRYCFTTDIPRVSQMVEEEGYKIQFPTLNYLNPRDGEQSSARLAQSHAQLYNVGSYLTLHASGNAIREVLRSHNVSMSGRKEDLVEKLASLSVKIYEKHEALLDEYFTGNRFIRVHCASLGSHKTFPLLDGLDLRNMILTMYMIKHLRGNTILEARHNNDTFDLLSLARSLIKREVSVEGSFMRVE